MTESRSVVAAGGGEEEGWHRMGWKKLEGHNKTFGSEGYVHYLDCSDSFGAVHICQNLPNCTL